MLDYSLNFSFRTQTFSVEELGIIADKLNTYSETPRALRRSFERGRRGYVRAGLHIINWRYAQHASDEYTRLNARTIRSIFLN